MITRTMVSSPVGEIAMIEHKAGKAARRRILKAIREAPRPFNTWAELAAAAGIPETTARYHCRRLRVLGAITYTDRRPWTLEVVRG